ncbi:MAG: hypothetical protein COT55_02920 [Candidatus Diapherotrites archaeon CG09_land_8_20_14_0_10_32_12]|nr:MAG: hypothetical protein COT55_02920 [Candidatus Diapherotrites archaeon CG09_land_8_20_14_0_10_32_12]
MVQIKYQVDSSNQLKSLEDAMKSFQSSYTLKGIGTIFVSKSVASILRRRNIVDLTPEKSSFIEEICSVSDEEPKGTVIKSSPNCMYLTIGETSYYIYYKAQ